MARELAGGPGANAVDWRRPHQHRWHRLNAQGLWRSHMESPRPLVLLVDDEPVGRARLQVLLEQDGYRVERAINGATGQARVAEGDIDLVLLGRRLPDGDGLTLCTWVRAHEGPVYLPIIVLTGLVDPAESHAGFVAGADGYLTQPFETQDVRDRVAAGLRVRRHSQGSY